MKPWFAAILALASFLRAAAGEENLSLGGNWRFALDRADAGIAERWFGRALPGRTKLPGSLPAQGIGDDITTHTPWTGGVKDSPWFTAPEYARYRRPGKVKVPFWLQPEKYYAGVAWYQRDVEAPKSWAGRRVVLSLERPHWETRVWVDDKFLGANDSLSTPHEYELGQLAPGKHRLTIRVDNRAIVDVGENSHAISDHTQGNWNGIVGKIELRPAPPVWIDVLHIVPNVREKKARVRVSFRNPGGIRVEGKISLFAEAGETAPRLKTLPLSEKFNTDEKEITNELEVQLGEGARTWDEFCPVLYRMTAQIRGEAGGEIFEHEKSATFGLREISTRGTQFILNGGKIFIRGTLECCIFPKTGHPPTDLDSWKRILRVAKSFGLNLLRFHSYCPPEAAFEAGDELGMYFQVETCWANQSTTLGDGRPVDQWVYAETGRILEAYGNHPSFLLMAYGNEPGGKNATAYLTQYVAHFKALDSRRLWTSGAGWPQIPENQFHVTPDPRVQAWGAGLESRINAEAPETTIDYRDYVQQRAVPVISHEIGQWCVYPNFSEISKYTGYLRPKNFAIFRDTLDANGLAKLANRFLLASGKLQTLCYKEDIESALRTPGLGGFELLDLHDFPGQGTALVGALDPFWDEKGYVTAKEYSRFCNRTVPLARMRKRVFTTNEKLEAQIEVANFGPQPLAHAVTEWKLVSEEGRIFRRGELPGKTIPVDNGIALGSVIIDFKNASAPAKYRLVVGIAGTHFENDWDVWLYPAQQRAEPRGISVTARFDDDAQKLLQAGGKVLLTIPGSQLRNYTNDPVKPGFSSIFWNTAWTGRQAPTTLGILCDPKNPALAEFPTGFCSNWQWWYLIHRAGALRLDLLPRGVDPIVRLIDDWVTARPLGLIVEGKVGPGKIVVCGFDLTRDAGDPVSRQMRASLLDYMNSKAFAPKTGFAAGEIKSLISEKPNRKL